MSEGSKDLFGKIDALFEKRAPDALVDKGLEYEDFPLLTEVIGTAPPAPVTWGEPERRVFDRRRENRRGHERRLGDRRGRLLTEEPQPGPEGATEALDKDGAEKGGADKGQAKQLIQAMESRLSDLFIRQQLRLEEAIRKVVREEMDKCRSEKSPGPR